MQLTSLVALSLQLNENLALVSVRLTCNPWLGESNSFHFLYRAVCVDYLEFFQVVLSRTDRSGLSGSCSPKIVK